MFDIGKWIFQTWVEWIFQTWAVAIILFGIIPQVFCMVYSACSLYKLNTLKIAPGYVNKAAADGLFSCQVIILAALIILFALYYTPNQHKFALMIMMILLIIVGYCVALGSLTYMVGAIATFQQLKKSLCL